MLTSIIKQLRDNIISGEYGSINWSIDACKEEELVTAMLEQSTLPRLYRMICCYSQLIDSFVIDEIRIANANPGD